MELKHQLQPYLKQLRLSGVLETLETRHRQAVEPTGLQPAVAPAATVGG